MVGGCGHHHHHHHDHPPTHPPNHHHHAQPGVVMDGRWLGPCLGLDLVFGLGLGLGIHLCIPDGHGVELPHWSHDQPDFARLADFGQDAVQVHEATGRVDSLYDNTSTWIRIINNHGPSRIIALGISKAVFLLFSLCFFLFFFCFSLFLFFFYFFL